MALFHGHLEYVMLVTKVLGNLRDGAYTNMSVDTIEIEWYQTQKRIARYTSKHGRDIALRFDEPLQIGLSHGDILGFDTESVIAIQILPTHILSIQTRNNQEIARLCYEVGNYHLPLFVNEGVSLFRTPFEKPLQRLLDRLGFAYKEEEGILDSKERMQASLPIIEPKLQVAKQLQVTLHTKAAKA